MRTTNGKNRVNHTLKISDCYRYLPYIYLKVSWALEGTYIYLPFENDPLHTSLY